MTRTGKIMVRCTRDELVEWTALAIAHGMTLSAWVRWSSLEFGRGRKRGDAAKATARELVRAAPKRKRKRKGER